MRRGEQTPMSVSSPFLSASPSLLARFTAQQPVLPSPMPAIWRPFSRFARSFPMPSPPSVFPRPSPALRGLAQFLPIICSFPMPCPLCTATQLVRPTKSNRCARPATRPEHPPRSSYCILPTTCLSPCLRRFVQRPNWPGTSRRLHPSLRFRRSAFPRTHISCPLFRTIPRQHAPRISLLSCPTKSLFRPLTPFPPCSIPFLMPTCPFAPASQHPQHPTAYQHRVAPCLSVLSHARPSFLTPVPRLRAPPLSFLLDQLVVFSPRKRPNRRYGAGRRREKGVRSRRGQRHPAKPQVAEIAWRQAEQKPSPNRPVPLIWAFCRRFSDNMKPKRAETTHKHSLNPKPRYFLSPGSALDDSILVRIPRIIPTDF